MNAHRCLTAEREVNTRSECTLRKQQRKAELCEIFLVLNVVMSVRCGQNKNNTNHICNNTHTNRDKKLCLKTILKSVTFYLLLIKLP